MQDDHNMTVSIWEMTVSIWDILSLWPHHQNSCRAWPACHVVTEMNSVYQY